MQQLVRLAAEGSAEKLFVKALDFRVIVASAYGLFPVVGIQGIGPCLEAFGIERNGISRGVRLATAADAAAGAGHHFDQVEVRFTAADFLRHLCWRLDNLDQSFSPATPQSFWQRHRSLVERLNPCDTDVRWRDWSRYSSRQATTMKLGGLVGTCTLPQEAISAMWPLLWLGQWVHVGKATTFGLGAYRLRPAP